MLKDARQLREQVRTSGAPAALLLLLMAATSISATTLTIIVPALPELTRLLKADPATVQLTVSLFLVGLAAAQLIMGPLSDRFGRRPVMMGGMALTGAVSLLAVVLANIESLIVARIFQAIGASTGIVVGRAIIRDLFERDRAASVLGLVATVMVIVPSFAPLMGGLLDAAFGWQAIFLFTATTSLGVMAWVALTLPETSTLNVIQGETPSFWADLKDLARARLFWGYVLSGAFASATFFAYLGGGPHVVVSLMGRSPSEFGVWFAISSLGYAGGNFGASRLAVRLGSNTLIWLGIAFEAAGASLAVLLAVFAMDWGPIIVFGPQTLMGIGNGLLLPAAIAGAVSIRPRAAGTAAGIMGCTQMAIGAACAQLGGMLLAGATSAIPLALILAGVVSALIVSYVWLGPRRR